MDISEISLASPVGISSGGINLTSNGKTNDMQNSLSSSQQQLMKSTKGNGSVGTSNLTSGTHKRIISSQSQTSPLLVGSSKMLMPHKNLTNTF